MEQVTPNKVLENFKAEIEQPMPQIGASIAPTLLENERAQLVPDQFPPEELIPTQLDQARPTPYNSNHALSEGANVSFELLIPLGL